MNRKIILSLIFFLGIFASCTDNFEELNTDPKNPLEVTGGVLFTNAQVELSNQLSSTNVNDNIWKLMAQYWTERSYTDEANWDIVNRNIPANNFRTYYAILKDLDDAKSVILAEDVFYENEIQNQKNRVAIIDIMEVYIYQRLVDIFGDIPYTEAIDSDNYTPKYDDAAEIYSDLIARLKKDLSDLDDSEGSFGSADLIYNGSIVSWNKFGNSLLLKLGIHIADGPLSALGQSTVEAVYTDVFASASDGAFFPYQAALPYVNPLYTDLVASGRSDFIMTNTLFDVMDNLSDPRMDDFFTDLENIIIPYGEAGGSYSTKVHYNPAIAQPAFNGFFLTYDEVQFYLAEAAARNWAVGNDAEIYFNEAVTASILSWGGTVAEAETLLVHHPFDSYTDWKEAVGTQAWIAMYTRGFIGYTFFRRLDYPAFNMPPNPPEGVTEIPTRFTYPVNEQTLNAANYTSAAAAIGGDKLTTKLFWDIN